jgi:hypothetical protein
LEQTHSALKKTLGPLRHIFAIPFQANTRFIIVGLFVPQPKRNVLGWRELRSGIFTTSWIVFCTGNRANFFDPSSKVNLQTTGPSNLTAIYIRQNA